jgi:hypothetical protein
VDAGDIACEPFNINEAIAQIEAAATELLEQYECQGQFSLVLQRIPR